MWNDPMIGIDWPLLDKKLLLSEKDISGKPLAEAEIYAGPYRVS